MKKLLDKKDRKLLYYLSLNARQSNTQLSKKIHLSKNAIAYRIERLQKEKIITQFSTVINIGSLGCTTIAFLMKFNEDIYEKKEIISYFKHHPFANWVITLSGQWDLFCEFIIDDITKMYQLTDEIIERWGKTINTQRLFISKETLRVEHLIADFYQDLKVEKIAQKERTSTIQKIDLTDKKILHHLNENSTLSYIQIANKINSSVDIIYYRIKNMQKNNLILKYFAEISLPKLGYTEYLYQLKLKNTNLTSLHKIKKQLQYNQNITYAFIDAASLTILFVCAYQNTQGIDHLSRLLRKEFQEIIEEQEYYIIKEQIQYTQFPKGMIK